MLMFMMYFSEPIYSFDSIYQTQMEQNDYDEERFSFKTGKIVNKFDLPIQKQENTTWSTWNIFATTMLTFGTLCFLTMNQKCSLVKEEDCVKHFIVPNLTTWIANILISAVSFFWVLILTITGRVSKIFFLFESVIIYLIVFYPPHTVNYHQLSSIFQFALILLLSFFTIFSLLILTCIITVKRYRYRSIITIAAALFIFYIYVNYRLETSCDKWTENLDGVSIDQSGKYCTVNVPEICWFDLLDGLPEITSLQDCTKYPKTIDPQWIQQIDKYSKIPSGTKYIELPRTEYFTNNERSLNYKDFQKLFFKQLRFANDTSSMYPQTEAYLNISSMEYTQSNVKRNDTLIKERGELFNMLQSKIQGRILPKNIIVVYVDTLSRARFMKKLPKSYNWFADQHKKPNQTHTFFQALRFISIDAYTRANVFAYEFGILFHWEEGTAKWGTTTGYIDTQVDSTRKPILRKRKNKHGSVHEELRQAGYIVSKVRSQCASAINEFHSPYYKLLDVPTVDHEFASIMCDPNFQLPDNPTSNFAGSYSIYKKCIYGKELNSYMLDYAKDFLNTYKDQPKYLEVQFSEAHEGTAQLIKYQDQPIFDFLEWLDQESLLEDSIVVMMSDHGFHLQGPYYSLESTLIEKYLPGLFMIADNRVFTSKQIQNLLSNQQKALTFFELYYLQKLIITPDEDPQQQFFEDNSILSGVIPKERGCDELPVQNHQISVCNSTQETK